MIHPLSSLQSLLRFLKTFCYIQKVPFFFRNRPYHIYAFESPTFLFSVHLHPHVSRTVPQDQRLLVQFHNRPKPKAGPKGSKGVCRIPGAFGGLYGHLGLGLGCRHRNYMYDSCMVLIWRKYMYLLYMYKILYIYKYIKRKFDLLLLNK